MFEDPDDDPSGWYLTSRHGIVHESLPATRSVLLSYLINFWTSLTFLACILTEIRLSTPHTLAMSHEPPPNLITTFLKIANALFIFV